MRKERDDGEKKPEKKKWKYDIRSWMGKPREGEWVPEPYLTTVTRTYTNQTRDEEGNLIVFEEVVHAHGGYRPRFGDEKSTRKAFYFRGARVWRE
jgi:hypothetical protein